MERKLKEKRQAWKADAKAINDGLARAREKIASAPDEAKAGLDEVRTMIDKWKNVFKEMAKAPTKSKATKKKKAS